MESREQCVTRGLHDVDMLCSPCSVDDFWNSCCISAHSPASTSHRFPCVPDSNELPKSPQPVVPRCEQCGVRPGLFGCTSCPGIFCEICSGTCLECGFHFCIPHCMLAHPHGEALHDAFSQPRSNIKAPDLRLRNVLFPMSPRSLLQAYFLRCSMYGSLHAGFALHLLASNQHCDTLQECRLLTCSLLLMASSETRVDLPFALFRLAYLFPLFPPSANTWHDNHEDLVLRLARPGEIVVDTEEIFLEELLCDPVPGRTVVCLLYTSDAADE